MSWSKLTLGGCSFVALVVACAGKGDFQPSGGAGGTAGDSGVVAKALGDNCTTGEQCESGSCADGVCCESACEGECTSCALPGTEGTCSPWPAGTKDTCAGEGKCGGACDGEGACAYPDSSTSCGVTSCGGTKQYGDVCDGQGECKPGTVECGTYRCGATACMTSCETSADCSLGNHCDENGECVGKGANGDGCSMGMDCESNECVDGTCCATACSAPASCGTGSCLCGESTCATGDACITWYADTDGDGFGDPANKKAGCASAPPAGGAFVTNDDDCYDDNVSAKPGQTAYFATHRGDGSFDYDCNGAGDKQHGSVLGLTCGPCGTKIGLLCVSCGGSAVTGGPKLYSNGYGCSKNNCTENKPFQGFKADVACGASGTLYTCSTTSCGSGETQAIAQQACR